MQVCRDLFGERPTRVILTSSDLQGVLARAAEHGLKAHDIGTVGGDRLVLEYENDLAVDVEIVQLEQQWRSALPRLLENKA